MSCVLGSPLIESSWYCCHGVQSLIPYKAIIDNCLLLPLFLVSCVSCLRVPDFLWSVLGLGNGRKKTNVDASKKVGQDLKYHRVRSHFHQKLTLNQIFVKLFQQFPATQAAPTSTNNWHYTKFSSSHSSTFLGHIMQHTCSCYNIWVSPISYETEPGGGRYRSPAHKLGRQLGVSIRSSQTSFESLPQRTWAPNFLTLDLPTISRRWSCKLFVSQG